MPMISSGNGPKLKHKWAIAAVGAVAAVSLGLLVFGGDDDNNEKQREPEAASTDNADRPVDPNQRFFVARRPSNFYRRANTGEGSLIGTFQPGSCVVMVGAKGEFTNTHIRSNTPGPASGYTDFNNFVNTDITNERECIARVEGVQTGGFAPRERYYTIGNNVPVPLYRNPTGEGEILTNVEPNSCVMRDGSGAIMPIIAQNAQGVRHRGYARYAEAPWQTFNSPSGLTVTITDDTCIATFASSSTPSASTPAYVPEYVAPPAPSLPPPR